MVKITMGQDDECQIARATSGAFQFFFYYLTLIGHARINQKIMIVSFNKIAINVIMKHKTLGNDFNLPGYQPLFYIYDKKIRHVQLTCNLKFSLVISFSFFFFDDRKSSLLIIIKNYFLFYFKNIILKVDNYIIKKIKILRWDTVFPHIIQQIFPIFLFQYWKGHRILYILPVDQGIYKAVFDPRDKLQYQHF